jgi:flagellar basal-body rod protein FlgB
MDLLQTNIFDLAEKRLAWTDKRQEVLSRNIANADTPGWRSSDLPRFADTLSSLTGSGSAAALARTQVSHLAGTIAEGPAGTAARPSQVAPDGNSVVVEDELAKVADTQSAQAVATNLYGKYMSFFRLALGRSG